MNERHVRVGARGNLAYEVHTLLQSWPLVTWGSSGHPVPALQCLLRAHGHQVTVDGIFAARTESAVRLFQTAQQLTVDGVVGAQTWGAVVSEVSEGGAGDAVRGFQRAVLLTPDGVVGTMTWRALVSGMLSF
jgi:peptidoglycan hydrolase-like protein with peptidoglycan-binding domain